MTLDDFDNAIRCSDLPVPDMPVKHLHPSGLYVRHIDMPAGSVLTSRVHLYEHLTVVLTGHCVVVDADGNRAEVQAPAFWITPAGTQRAIHVLRDSQWMTVHATEETDPERLFELLTCASMADYQHRLTVGDI